MGRLLVAAVLLAGCTRTTPQPAVQTTSVLDSEFEFACSPNPGVECEGLFDVRGDDEKKPAVSIIRTGEDAFRARMQMLEAARKSIRVQALIFRADEAGLMFAEALKRRRKAGLDVRVIVDAMSNLDWQTQWMYFDLKQHGVEVEGFEALYLNWLTADLQAADPLRPNKRFHDKLWIIDGEDPGGAAIVGGLNIANEYFRIAAQPIDRWRDQDVHLTGSVVADVTAAFDRNYSYFKGLKTRLPAAFNPDNSWNLTRSVTDKIGKVKVPDWTRPELVRQAEHLLTTRWTPSPVPALSRFLQSRPRFEETYIEQAYAHLIDNAQTEVLIANAYFVPSRQLRNTLKRAAQRGVRVVILTNSPETNDISAVAVVSRWTFDDLMSVNAAAAEGSLEIYEWVGPRLNEGTLHAKFAVFDRKRAVVGSYNLDPRSEKLNSETAIVFEGAAIVEELAQMVLDEDLPKSNRVTADEAARYRNPPELDQKFELLFALPIKEWL